ncbi:hypothetical protein [Hydrogenophaga sp. 2FB]|uniref:hypothetical protein n=1 Tax=Hydrogenophaga sp. 2FB TaxID=2502187 RepID=UPI0014859771|nr:hypothetical protein [Hydrogenophaga sp. 2FB]
MVHSVLHGARLQEPGTVPWRIAYELGLVVDIEGLYEPGILMGVGVLDPSRFPLARTFVENLGPLARWWAIRHGTDLRTINMLLDRTNLAVKSPLLKVARTMLILQPRFMMSWERGGKGNASATPTDGLEPGHAATGSMAAVPDVETGDASSEEEVPGVAHEDAPGCDARAGEAEIYMSLAEQLILRVHRQVRPQLSPHNSRPPRDPSLIPLPVRDESRDLDDESWTEGDVEEEAEEEVDQPIDDGAKVCTGKHPDWPT